MGAGGESNHDHDDAVSALWAVHATHSMAGHWLHHMHDSFDIFKDYIHTSQNIQRVLGMMSNCKCLIIWMLRLCHFIGARTGPGPKSRPCFRMQVVKKLAK